MKLSVFTVIVPDRTMEETISLLKRAGYDGVEWRCRELPPERKTGPYSFHGNFKFDLTPKNLPPLAPQMKRACDDAGLETISIASYLKLSDLEELKLICEGCSACGARMFRVGPPGYDRSQPYPELFSRAVDELGKVSELAREYGLKAVLEMHMGNIMPSASLAWRLVSGFPPERVGVIYDPGNMVVEGYECYRMGLELLGGHLAHVHVKNGVLEEADARPDGTRVWRRRWVPLKEGIADWRQILADLMAVGYEGYFSNENFSDEPLEEKLANDARHLNSLLAELRDG